MTWRWIISALWASAAMGSGFAGPASCRPCHPTQHTTQSRSHHALALRPGAAVSLAALLGAQPLRERSGISFEYEPAENGARVHVRQGNRSATAVLLWAFGSGAQGITPVGFKDGRFFEHRISWYAAAQAGRRTLGHSGTPSPDPRTALGVTQEPETIFRCFNCHATGVKPGPDLQSMIPGVTCERCHGPAAEHVQRGAAMRPAKLSRDGVMELCGSCHRLPPGPAAIEPEAEDPLSIRFAPVGLSASACFKGSKELSCITCHDPHQDASRDGAHYEQKCTGCHEPTRPCSAGHRVECLRCHMQKRSPAPYLTFTDHRIRVYR